MPLIMDNSKYGQNLKDEYFVTSRKILSRNDHMQYEALIFYI